MAKKTVAAKKRNVKVDANGQLHVHSSFNNIIVSLANSEGQVISWSSAGKMGFRGSKKNTPYAAQMAAQDCAKVAYDLGLRKVKAYVKGPGNGRESAIRTVHGAGIEVTEIIDVTPEKITVKKSLEEEEQILTSTMPCVLTTLSGMNNPRYMNCNDIVDSFNNPVKIMTFDDLDLDQSVVGLAGSPTKVHATFTKDVSAETQTYNMPAKETAELIAKTLKEKQLITK
jgi:small subunit ribosomal protein S11